MAKNENVMPIAIALILADYAWNCRSGAWEKDVNPDTGSGYEALKASIASDGVKTPVVVRPLKNKDGSPNGKYSLVSGFRRFKAVTELKQETIPCLVRDLNDADARLENIRENTAREDLKGADLAYAILEVAKQNVSDLEIAKKIGKSQPYVSKLHSIMTDVLPKLVKAWRESTVDITVSQMYVLSRLPKDRQEEEFNKYVKGREAAETKDDGKKNKKLEVLKKKAYDYGFVLGCLARLSYVGKVADDWEEMSGSIIDIPSKFVARQRRSVGNAMEKGYTDGMVEPAPEETDDIEE